MTHSEDQTWIVIRVISDSVINTLPQRPEETCLDEIPTIQEVEKAISQIKDNKSAGPDGIC